MYNGKIVVICGATASGKSGFALSIAQNINGVILNADSMQVYKELPILTAQPKAEDYKIAQHKLYGIEKSKNDFSVGKWLQLVHAEIQTCIKNQETPIIAGGTGLYIKTLLYGITSIPDISAKIRNTVRALAENNSTQDLHKLLSICDPQLAEKLNINDKQRILRGLEVFEETKIPLSHWHSNKIQNQVLFERNKYFIIYVNPPREEVYKRCDVRFLEMIRCGVLDEVQNLIDTCDPRYYPKALGVQELVQFLNGEVTLEYAITKAQQKTRNYAKRQSTWFNNQLEHDAVM